MVPLMFNHTPVSLMVNIILYTLIMMLTMGGAPGPLLSGPHNHRGSLLQAQGHALPGELNVVYH